MGSSVISVVMFVFTYYLLCLHILEWFSEHALLL